MKLTGFKLFGISWGSHLSSVSLIYKSVIQAKLDYGSLLYGSITIKYWNKVKCLQVGCLRSVLGALRLFISRAIEVESACSPLKIRARWLSDKFVLKHYIDSSVNVVNSFNEMSKEWRYILKSLPLLLNVAISLNYTYINLDINRSSWIDQPYLHLQIIHLFSTIWDLLVLTNFLRNLLVFIKNS